MAKKTSQQRKGKGWHGDKAGHARVGQLGGISTLETYGEQFYHDIGSRGGKASSGKFREGDPRAREAGRQGGRARKKA